MNLITLHSEATKRFYSGLGSDVVSDIDFNFSAIAAALAQKTVITVGNSAGADYVCTGTNDDISIQAAVDYANSVRNSLLWFRDVRYYLSHPVSLIGRHNLTLFNENNKAIFCIPQASLGNFNNGFMFLTDATATDITMRGLYFDGGYSGYIAPAAGQGGGIAPGTRWRVENCTFADFNYFGMWLGTAGNNVKLFGNRFIGPGSGVDHIGGGGSTNVEIAYNLFEANCAGNLWDNVGGSNFRVHHNVNLAPGSFYIEAMSNIDVDHNKFLGTGNIAAQSDNGYSPATITNSKDISITDNKLNGGYIQYKVDTDPVKVTSTGGRVTIARNNVPSPLYYGILMLGGGDGTTPWGSGYQISENIITDANSANATSLNTGFGVVNPSAINVSQLSDLNIADNVCVDSRVTPQQRYGIQIGNSPAPSALNQPNKVQLSGNYIRGYVSSKGNVISPTYTTAISLDGHNSYAQGNITGATTFDISNGTSIEATQTGNITVTLTSGMVKGDELTLRIVTAGFTQTWPANLKVAGGALVMTGTSVLQARWNGINWEEVARSLNVS